MLFMCPSANGKIFAIKEKYRWVDGQREQIESGYIVEFRRDRGIEPWVADQARRTFQFRGIQVEQDMMTPIDPVMTRVSFFDTDWVPEDKRAQVEKVLLNHPGLGSDFAIVEKPVLPKPWPAYDQITTGQGHGMKWVAEQIVSRVTDLGIDPETVIGYEQINENREEVISALVSLGELDDAPIEVVA